MNILQLNDLSLKNECTQNRFNERLKKNFCTTKDAHMRILTRECDRLRRPTVEFSLIKIVLRVNDF